MEKICFMITAKDNNLTFNTSCILLESLTTSEKRWVYLGQ